MYPFVELLCPFYFLCPLTSSLSTLKRYRSPYFKKWFSLSCKCAFYFCKCSLWFHACDFFYFSQKVWTFLLSLFMQYKCPFFMKYLYLAFPSMCCLFFHRFDLSFQFCVFLYFFIYFFYFAFLLGLAYWAFGHCLRCPSDNRLLTPQVVCNSALCKPISKFSFLLLPIFCITFAFTQLRSDFDQLSQSILSTMAKE